MRRRQGFTIIELLVSMALIVLIMSIISQAFVEGLETFRQLKGIGDLQEQLRTAAVPLRDDLMARHLNGDKKSPVKLSELGDPNNPIMITDGFFRIEGGATPNVLEGQDPDGLLSFTATSHALLFTINTGAEAKSPRTQWLSVPLLGTGATQTALAPPIPPPPTPTSTEAPRDFQSPNPPLFLSSWAEVAWFLVPMIDPSTGQQFNAAGGGAPLFTLHRRIRLLVQNNNAVNTSARETTGNIGLYPEVSCENDPGAPGNLYFNRSDSSNRLGPAYRGGMNAAGVIDRTPLGLQNGTDYTGFDRVLSDVISFQVQYLTAGSTTFTDASAGVSSPGVYDTAIPPPGPATLRILALQITIRVWDAKTEQARQVTIVQDM